MATIHITNRKGNKLQLTGDILSGDTYSMKDYIKAYMDGKWVADKKAWQVNVEKVNRLIAQSVLSIDGNPAPQTTRTSDAIAKPGMSYNEFARRMNSENSDL